MGAAQDIIADHKRERCGCCTLGCEAVVLEQTVDASLHELRPMDGFRIGGRLDEITVQLHTIAG